MSRESRWPPEWRMGRYPTPKTYGWEPPVETHDPTRIKPKPATETRLSRSPRATTPTTSATSGFTYVITLARLGPASAINRKKTSNPAAVQMMPSTAIAIRADTDGSWPGNVAIAGGSSATGAINKLAVTGPHRARSEIRRL